MTIIAEVTGISGDTGTSGSDGVTSDNTLDISVNASGASDVEVFLDGVKIGDMTETAMGSGQWTFDHSGTELADGTYAITAIAIERVVGGGGFVTFEPGPESASFSVTIDTAGPGELDQTTNEIGAISAVGLDESNPAIATLVNGKSAVAYQNDASTDITVTLLGANGSGGDFIAVNVETGSVQSNPTVAALDTGGFVVLWQTDDAGNGGDGNGGSIKGALFDENGVRVGDEFLAHAPLIGNQTDPAVAALPGGGFVVVFDAGFGNGIRAAIHDGAGGVTDFTVITESGFKLTRDPSVVALDGGGFVVGWRLSDQVIELIEFQKFDAMGVPVGDKIAIDQVGFSSNLTEQTLIALPDGGFLAAYLEREGPSHAVKVQRYDANGAEDGNLQTITTASSGALTDISALLLDTGNILISWTSEDGDSDGTGLKAQVITPDGTLIGDVLNVNTGETGDQTQAVFTTLGNGNLFAAWTDAGGANSVIDGRVFPFEATPTKVVGISDDTGSDGTDGVTNDNTLTIIGDSVPNGSVEVFIDGASVGTVTADGEGLWIFDHTGTELPDGQHEVTARPLDLAGNPGAFSDPFDVTVDTTAPGTFGKSGGEILVNTQTSAGNQTAPDATTLENGNIVVVFRSSDAGFPSFLAQILDPSGTRIGDEIDVSPGGFNDPFVLPKVSALEGGRFVVVTADLRNLSDNGNDFLAQVFDSNGAEVGAQVTVASFSSIFNSLNAPDVTGLPGGGYVVVWEDDANGNVFARAFDANGTETIAQFQVNDFSADNGQLNPKVVALTGGGFVVGWSGKGSATDFDSFRLFDAAGVPQGNQVLINNLPDADDSPLAMAALSTGGYAVAFVADDGSFTKLLALFYDATGTAGGQIDVALNLSNPLRNPAITQLADGNILVTWEAVDGLTADTSGAGVFGQVLDPTGAKIGNAFLVNTLTEADQTVPTLTPLQDGGVFTAWQTDDPNQDGDGGGIKAQVIHGAVSTEITSVKHPIAGVEGIVGNGAVVQGTAEPGATVEVTVGTILAGGAPLFREVVTVGADGTWTSTVSGLTTEGLFSLAAKATDAAGNVETQGAAQTITVDLTPPTLSAIDLVDASDTGSSPTDNVTTDTTPTISFTAEAGSTVSVNFGEGNQSIVVQGTGAQQEVTLQTPYLTDGVKNIRVEARDTASNLTTQILPITINRAPVAAALALAGDEDSVIGGTVLATDLDGDALTFALQTGPSNGTAEVAADGTFTYTPASDFNGADSFVFSVSDGNGGTDTETVSVTVNPVPDTISVPGAAAGSPGQLNGNSFTNLDPGDKITVNTDTPFSSSAVTVDPSTGQVSIPGATFTVDIDLSQNSFLVVQGASGVSEIVFLDVLQGNGADLLEGVSVQASAINGIAPAGFLAATNASSFKVTFDASQGLLDNALGSFVRNADGSISDVKVLFGSNSTATGTQTTVGVAEGGTLEFFLIQDFGNSGVTLADDLRFDFTTSTPELVSGGTVLDLEIFFSGDTSQNSDGVQHFLSGVVPGGGALRVGVEDVLGGGDQDYQDFVFTVEALEGLM